MGRSNWLNQALEYFSHLPKNISRNQLWRDFLLWAAYQAGEPRLPDAQAQILAPYGGDIRTLFMGAYRSICLGIAENPHQNAPLMLGNSFGVESEYIYDEKAAEWFFTQQLAIQTGKPTLKKALSSMDIVTFRADNCDTDYGSSLIGISNVIQAKFPNEYQERALFVATGNPDGHGHLTAFIQLSIMGMPCYVTLDGSEVYINNQALFAPNTAICSPEFYSEYWDWTRWMELTSSSHRPK